MSSQGTLGSSMLFQSINDDLNASLATADELSQEFSSLLSEASNNNNTKSKTSSLIQRDTPQSPQLSWTSNTRNTSTDSSNGSSSQPSSPGLISLHPMESISNKNIAHPPIFSTSSLPSPTFRREGRSPLPQMRSDSYSYGQRSPRHSPSTQRRSSPYGYDSSPRGSVSYMDRSPSPNHTGAPFDKPPRSGPFHTSSNLLSPYDNSQMGRRSPRRERSPSPLSFNQPMSSTLPRNFTSFAQPDEGVQRQKTPAKWNETDLDASYERKPQHSYDKTEWLRPSVPNSNWRESNLDGPPPASSLKKDSHLRPHHASLPRNARVSVPPDLSSPVHSPYHPQPIISRISIPPISNQSRQRKPIPLSVIMRLQNPDWGARPTHHQREADMSPYQPASPMSREYFLKSVLQPQQPPPELRQPAIYSEVLKPGDVDAELERLDLVQPPPPVSEKSVPAAPRPLSPTRLQPVVAHEAQIQANLEELLRIRAEIPRALKKRGSEDLCQPLKMASQYEPNQYKHLINKLFRKKGIRRKGEQWSGTSSSSDEEMSPTLPATHTPTAVPYDYKHYHSILRRSSRERKSSGRRARLSPLVLLLDGSLVGELDTVQKAVQEISDPSQPNDEGITALHNAICGGHYNVVDFLVRIGANVSAPDSHGWTPLHCAASCNDRPLCEFLVRNGAAIMAMTESDGTIAYQKCDPYAVGFEECESFLRSMGEAMGVENSGVLYALWSFVAQNPDELSFKDGDMVTILQKPEGSDWWWASLCGREGFVPNNYFGLFPKVRPKSLC
ncbi:relA-associated inhibitor isoform X2 [Genypterus blacodes]|uniref:relA-associated inhibitor isoform X2 n=1 Tax=Genypterus blacodes TaxID=154954 RepID=UPI003F757801